MKPLPSIARQRLGAVPSNAHPDPGVLTAFVEQSLGRAQRQQILYHLAACSRCNQLVALAAPEKEETLVLTGRKWRESSFRPWRWVTGSALAGALATAAFFMFGPMRVSQPPVSSPPFQIAAKSLPAEPVAKAPQPTVQPERQPHKTARAPEVLTATTRTADADVRTDKILVPHAADVTMQTPPPLPGDGSVQPVIPERSAVEPPPGMSSVAAPAAGPCWRVSDAGALEESRDCAGGWASIALPEPVVVRVVQSVGSVLWVGGKKGALFSSSDAGQHWNKVQVPAMSADVVAIVFGTPTHGWVSTANGESWVTTDGGVTWKHR